MLRDWAGLLDSPSLEWLCNSAKGSGETAVEGSGNVLALPRREEMRLYRLLAGRAGRMRDVQRGWPSNAVGAMRKVDGMYVDPQTSKGWADAEERTFVEITAASRLARVQAIQLWKRCRKDTGKALRLAKENYPRLGAPQLAALRKAREARWGTIVQTETGRNTGHT
jgi:hypothetical protein